MKIVYVDSYTINPGDLDWSPLTALGDVTFHERTGADEIVRRSADAGIVLTNKVPYDARTLAKLPELRYIGVTATGVNIVDLQAASARGVVVTNVPGYGTASVAQHVFALLLELTSHVGAHNRAVHEGRWSSGPDWCFTVSPMVELAGKTMGIVGLGSIGRRVARIAKAFGMQIAAARQASTQRLEASGELAGLDVRWLEIDELFAAADVLSLHCPLTDQTQRLVNADRLAKMKPGALLINTGRGPLLDEQAVARALREDRLGGVGVDVLSVEPPPADNPLLSAPRCIMTPHIAWATREARRRCLDIAAANIRAFLDGKPVNVVNPK